MFDPINLLVLLVFVLMITVLVAAHEYGHYLFARVFGMDVEEFAIGMGKPTLWTWMRKKGTEFTIRPWPVGGFVRIAGMIPEEDGSEVNVPNGFYSKAPWKRFIVLLAGPTFSVLAGFILLFGVYAIAGKDKQISEIESLTKGMPAERAGLKVGDRIVAVNGKPVSDRYGFASTVRANGPNLLRVDALRNGQKVTATFMPELDSEPVPVLGPDDIPTGEKAIQPRAGITFRHVKIPVSTAYAFNEAANAPVRMFVGVVQMFTTPKELGDNLGGPGSIISATKASTKLGASYIIELAAILSISVGFLNLLPVPPLDGGQMAVALAEMFRRGKRLSMRVQTVVNALGFALVACLILTAFTLDIKRFAFPEKEKPMKTVPIKKK